MNLQAEVKAAFGSSGQLSQVIDGFQPRQGQTDMAIAIAQTLEEGGALVVEAGTGVGKTFSYLVPTLLSGARCLLSTATKTLQDQLFGRDLPLLVNALGLPTRIALLKGRSSYLCLHRMDVARQSAIASDKTVLRTIGLIEKWALTTASGDLAELGGLDERSPVIPLISSTRENCLGSTCPKFRSCHVNQARRDALAADIVVINHHLFFADLAVRESGMAELLPSVNTVVFDEAHQLNEIGVQFLGEFLTTGQILECARDVLATGLSLARGLADWQQVAAELEFAGRELRLTVSNASAGGKLRWTNPAPDGVHEGIWKDGLEAVQHACAQAVIALETVSEIAPDFDRLAQRLRDVGNQAVHFQGACVIGSVRWLDVGAQIRLVESPLDIAIAVQQKMLHASDEHASRRSWVFTSATLGDDKLLTWFTEPCGLAGARILKVGSPFNYPDQACLFVPQGLPKPAEANHSKAVAELVAWSANTIGGRTLVLTTTLRALREITEVLQLHFIGSRQIEILAQGQQTKRELMARFRQGSSDGKRGCVLVASASFWEGVDVPGDSLQLVFIDKLPFPPPGDPMVEARSRRLEQSGRSPFNDYSLPEAAVALKQGAGRLIRMESDHGILVVCDGRLATMGYGRRLIAALPPMRRLDSEIEFSEALIRLTKFSTTDLNPA